jgi:hypothetical protein
VTLARPRGLSWRRAERLLAQAKEVVSIAGRVEILSRHFLGYPYKSNPLIGSADTAEVFSVSLDHFDCVTYLETILALARASDVDEFTACLRQIRYEHGRIRWELRHHYMTAWIRTNIREGIIAPISTSNLQTVNRARALDHVPGIAARRTTVKCVPKRAIPALVPHLRSGDLIFFVSTRRNLDIFHAAIIVSDGQRVRIRHASRSQGGVVEQELSEFLMANRMAGVTVARPRPVARRILPTDSRRHGDYAQSFCAKQERTTRKERL